MRQSVEQCRGHLGIAEDGRPFAEGEIGGDDDRGAFVEPADEVEQELAAGLGEGQIAEFVEDQEVEAGQVIGEPPLAAVAGFGLQPIDEIDDVVEAAAAAGADATAGDGDCQMGLAGAGAADQDDVALLLEETAGGEVVDLRWLIGVPSNSKPSMSLAKGSLAMVSWYLIERACFSLISALSRSPTMRCGSCWRLTAVAMTSSNAAYSLSSFMNSKIWVRSIRGSS